MSLPLYVRLWISASKTSGLGHLSRQERGFYGGIVDVNMQAYDPPCAQLPNVNQRRIEASSSRFCRALRATDNSYMVASVDQMLDRNV